MNDVTAGLTGITRDTLAPLVRAALRADRAEVIDWRHEPYGHSLDEVQGTARAIFRFNGTARTLQGATPWTLVLKVVTAPGTPADPSSPANGDREPLAYRTGLLSSLAGISAPRCLGVADRPAGGYWIWLEEVVDTIGRQWPRERYLLAARHLAQFNGTPVNASIASLPWLSRSPLREAVREMAAGTARLRDARHHPAVAQAISAEAADTLLTLESRVGPWLEQLDRLPQTLCHWDAHRANLMSRIDGQGRVETTAIDWAGLGWGPLGVELSKMVSQTVNFFGMRPDALPALDADLSAHYVDGLRDAEWNGDVRAVRFAHAAASAARLIVRTSSALDLALNERARAAFERAAGVSFGVLADRFRQTLPYYLGLVEEAETLAGRV